MKKQNRFTKTLNQLLKQKNISQREIARETKIPLSTLNGYTAGLEPRELDKLKTIADYLNVSIDFLVNGIDQKHNLQFIESVGIIHIVQCKAPDSCYIKNFTCTENQTVDTEVRNIVSNNTEEN